MQAVNDKRASQKERKAQNIMADKEAKSTKVNKPKKDSNEAKTTFVRGILGLVLLTVFGSIAFMTVVIWTGTENPIFKILTAPAALFDAFIAFVAFSKILK